MTCAPAVDPCRTITDTLSGVTLHGVCLKQWEHDHNGGDRLCEHDHNGGDRLCEHDHNGGDRLCKHDR